MNRILTYFTGRPRLYRGLLLTVVGTLLPVAIGMMRYVTGPEYAISVFYMLPIILVAWKVGRVAGFFVAFIAAGSWLLADLRMIDSFSSRAVPFINETLRLIVFLLVAYIISSLRQALKIQKDLARKDPLTGINNRRAFYEFAGFEINKARRFNDSLTMIYIDLDNFKAINDTCGHKTGDHLLVLVGGAILKHTRITDTIARFGGDEFGILLPHADNAAALQVAEKIREKLQDIMIINNWPVTFSMGVATFRVAPESVDRMVAAADGLMYRAKTEGKNRIISDVVE